MPQNISSTKDMIAYIESAEKEAEELLQKVRAEAQEKENASLKKANEMLLDAKTKGQKERKEKLLQCNESLAEKTAQYEKNGKKEAEAIKSKALKNMDRAIDYCYRKVVD